MSFEGQILGQGHLKVSSSSRSSEGQTPRSLEGELKVKVKSEGQGHLKVNSRSKVKVI